MVLSTETLAQLKSRQRQVASHWQPVDFPLAKHVPRRRKKVTQNVIKPEKPKSSAQRHFNHQKQAVKGKAAGTGGPKKAALVAKSKRINTAQQRKGAIVKKRSESTNKRGIKATTARAAKDKESKANATIRKPRGGAPGPREVRQKASKEGPKKPGTWRNGTQAPKPSAVPSPPASTAAADAIACDLRNVVVLRHVRLVQRDIELNMDKYYVLQLLRAADGFYVATRWGRTGTAGQAKLWGPVSTETEASAELDARFREKTGNEAAAIDGVFVPRAGKYDLAGAPGSRADVRGGRLWQYWVDDGVDGKRVGWYDYTAAAAAEVEAVWSEWRANNRLDVRCVQSGYFAYRIDFNTMTQTNVTHPARTQRRIRRNVETA